MQQTWETLFQNPLDISSSPPRPRVLVALESKSQYFLKKLVPILPIMIKWACSAPNAGPSEASTLYPLLAPGSRRWGRKGGEVLWGGTDWGRAKNTAAGSTPVEWSAVCLWPLGCLFFTSSFFPPLVSQATGTWLRNLLLRRCFLNRPSPPSVCIGWNEKMWKLCRLSGRNCV